MRFWTCSASLAVMAVPAVALAQIHKGPNLSGSQQPESGVYAAQDTPVVIVVTDLLGSTVRSVRGEEVGTIDDLIVEDGRIHTAVLSIGGILGIGDRLVGVPYSDLRRAGDGDAYVVEKTVSQLSGLAGFVMPRAPNPLIPGDAAASRHRDVAKSLPAKAPEPLKVDPDLAEIDPRLATGVAANEAAFGEQLDHETYDNDAEDDTSAEKNGSSRPDSR